MQNDLHMRLGFTRGKTNRWCASCNREFRGGASAFTCGSCAATQADEVRKDCESAGLEDFDGMGVAA